MMMSRAWPALAAAALLACGGTTTAKPEGKPPVDSTGRAPSAAAAAFDKLEASFLAAYYASHPITATRLGIHRHDGAMPGFGGEDRYKRARALTAQLRALANIRVDELPRPRQFDHRILDHAIRAELLELRMVRSWQHNPMAYAYRLGSAVSSLVDRKFAPLDKRLTALIQRLNGFGAVIAAAKANLKQVPKVFATLGIKSTRGVVSYLRGKLLAALRAQGLDKLDRGLRDRFTAAHAGAVKAAEAFAGWLERTILPGAKGDYRLGRAVLGAKLRYEEHVDIGIDALRDMNEAAIKRYTAWITREAKRVDPTKAAAQVIADIVAKHPSPDRLIPTAATYVKDAKKLVVKNNLVTLPMNDLPTVRPTPEYARSGFASMSVPGPFETAPLESYYNITNVDPTWSADKQHQHLTYFNFPGLLGISVHEAMPGHFVQLAFRRKASSDLRKVFQTGTWVEGWAHYTEQMMVDEGLGGGDANIRIGQLRRALQRHARWYAALALHVYGEPMDKVVARYQKIAFFAKFPAQREVVRASYNPTYLYYALGRMQILALRADYEAKQKAAGKPYRIGAFHDQLLTLNLPLSLARRALGLDTSR